MAHRWSLHTLFLSLACSVAWAQDPAGVEFQVNSHTTSAQWVPGVASDANGNFVVVWASDGQDGSGHGVFGQRFGASGVPQGSELQVNSYTTGQQFDPAVGSDASGNFVVTWESIQDGSALGIFGQRFSTSGLPQGAEFQVNSYTTNDQFLPAVASVLKNNIPRLHVAGSEVPFGSPRPLPVPRPFCICGEIRIGLTSVSALATTPTRSASAAISTCRAFIASPIR